MYKKNTVFISHLVKKDTELNKPILSNFYEVNLQLSAPSSGTLAQGSVDRDYFSGLDPYA